MEIKFNLSQLKKASKELKMHINQNVVLISGEMGVGKTTLIKELLSLYGVTDNVASPTSVSYTHLTLPTTMLV